MDYVNCRLCPRECGVDRIQGYALAKPMPEDRLLGFYRKKD